MKTKKSFTVIFLTCILCGITYGQVQTPNGTSVEYHTLSAGNVASIEAYAASWIAARGWTNDVIKTEAATESYNCHSYAWYMSAGGVNTYWINAYLNSQLANFNPYVNSTTLPTTPNNLKKYWDDGSYFETIESHATKVWYGASNASDWTWSASVGWENFRDHSAVRITSGTHTGKYESKWGAWPRYIHPCKQKPV